MGLVVLVSPRVRPTIFLPPKNDIPGISIPERNPKPSTYWVAAAAPAAMELHVPPFDYNKPWKRSIDFCGKTLHRERERRREKGNFFFVGLEIKWMTGAKLTLYYIPASVLQQQQSFSVD